MKYLYENPRTKDYLSTNGETAAVIGYFFRELGMNEETGSESLLASILEHFRLHQERLHLYTPHSS